MKPKAHLLILLTIWVSFPMANGQQGALSLDQATLDGHAKMEATLSRIREVEFRNNPYFGVSRITELERLIARTPFEGNEEAYIRMSVELAVMKAEQGKLETALRILRFCKKWADTNEATPEKRAILTLTLGQIYLRLAETRNCCARYSPESCILPLQDGALHTDQWGSRNAITAAEEVLRIAPTPQLRTNAIWLLNLAHMTLGQ
ncbi:MAG: hypothetical protein AAGH89_15265, partial [Verrucomicrobiota bacterium]